MTKKKNVKKVVKSTAIKGGTKKLPAKSLTPTKQAVSPLRVVTPETKKLDDRASREVTPQDYANARTIITEIMDKHSCTPWQSKEMNRFILKEAPVIIALAALLEASDQAAATGNPLPDGVMSVKAIIEHFVRPENSFLNIESPCPPAFMQGEVLHVDGLSVNLSEYSKDPDFWWQPVLNPHAKLLCEAIRHFKNRCESGEGVNFSGIKNKTAGSTNSTLLNQ